ncbi:MAG: hypothetical protein IJ358_03420 [Clostridia bacterium]|nr:hypothetical protein [Clostridia bacterium]
MRIIKKLIIRNRLKKELNSLNWQLKETGYHEMCDKLRTLVYNPDQYAIVLQQIHQTYGDYLARKHQLEAMINKLSGKNLFYRTLIDEFTK